MTGVCIYRSKGRILGFEARGHAGFAPSGEDIVCAAISAVTQTAVLGLTEALGLQIELERDDEAGSLRAMLPGGAPEGAQLILKTMILGLGGIQKEYPKAIRITYRERRSEFT